MTFPVTPTYASRRSPVLGDAVVATSQPLASQAGLSMLAQGGNAADAALAAAITLTLVEPTGCGLGSDAFAIVWDGQQLHGLNASGRSPAGWTPERFAGLDAMPRLGWEAVTVPGAVGGWVALWRRFGRLAFPALFEPAIGLAERGFLLSPLIGEGWARGAEVLSGQSGFAPHFMPGGRVPRPGERVVNRDLAASLCAIAESEGEAFYTGALAEAMAADAARHGAVLTMDDLAHNQADWVGTIGRSFDGASLREIPPNGQGLAACMALGLLDHTPVRDFGPDDPRALHLMIEAMKLALRDGEAFIADGDHMAPIGAADLLDDGYLAARAALIDPEKAQDFGAGAPRDGGTVCLAAADADGMMVSFIQSNYAGFGSGVVVPGTGIHLQNRGAGFTLAPDHPNRVGPRKRPFHTIIPGFVMRGKAPHMAFGLMGGPMQAQGHVQMILRTQLWSQDVQTAADAPRWRVDAGLDVACEAAWPAATLDALAGLGHRVRVEGTDAAFGFGGAQLVQRVPGGGYVAGSDPRKDGAAVAL